MVSVGRSTSRPAGDAAVQTNKGPRIGPISIVIGASAATVYRMMATFEGGDEIATNGGDIHLGSAEHIREFTTVVSLPLGFRRLVRTREAIRLVPPNAIQFRHLAGPVRGLAEVISVRSHLADLVKRAEAEKPEIGR